VSHGVPDGFHTVTPRIVVADAGALVRFLRVVFGATGELRIDAPSQLTIGDSLVMVSEAGDPRFQVSSTSTWTMPTRRTSAPLRPGQIATPRLSNPTS
jgi:hypothetical protein